MEAQEAKSGLQKGQLPLVPVEGSLCQEVCLPLLVMLECKVCSSSGDHNAIEGYGRRKEKRTWRIRRDDGRSCCGRSPQKGMFLPPILVDPSSVRFSRLDMLVGYRQMGPLKEAQSFFTVVLMVLARSAVSLRQAPTSALWYGFSAWPQVEASG